ncbi:MAG: DCC1-like thiol-disulfide oxidoreductase family protein [Pseudomonadota bacterium]
METETDHDQDSSEILLVYDRDCPACHYYCQLVQIRKTVGNLKVINAREDTRLMREITDAGLDIDQGMVLKLDDRLYYGSEAIHMLSLLSTRSGLFNRVNFWLFRSRHISRVLYPILRAGRNLLLKILGRTKINNLNIEGNERF